LTSGGEKTRETKKKKTTAKRGSPTSQKKAGRFVDTATNIAKKKKIGEKKKKLQKDTRSRGEGRALEGRGERRGAGHSNSLL